MAGGIRPARHWLLWVVGLTLVAALVAPVVAVARPHPAAVTPTHPAAPAAAPGVDPILIGAGDIADCGERRGSEATARLLDSIIAEAAGPIVVFAAGDNAYPRGSDQDYARCYDPTWGRFREITFPAAGNHDYESRGAQPYFRYFSAVAGQPSQGYYSYELGRWHIIVLNSNCGEVDGCGAGSAQERWLRADLAASAATCTLAYWHHPRFTNGNHRSDATYQPFWQALYDAGAEVVLAGHDHNYQQYTPLDPAGRPDPARGIREFVAGTGGAALYQLRPPTAVTESQDDTTYGVLKLTLHDDGYDWEFLPVAGGTYSDRGSAGCH